MKKIRIAIIGTGNTARRYLRILREITSCEVVSAYSQDENRAKKFAHSMNIQAISNFQELVMKPDIDACIFVGSPQNNIRLIEAAEGGKHILVDKPLSDKLEDGLKILSASKKAKLVCGGIFQRRYDESFLRAREIIDSKIFGSIKFVEVFDTGNRAEFYRQGGDWRKSISGGVILSHLIHTFDLLSVLLGKPQKVFARCYNFKDYGSEDCVSASMVFPNEIPCNVYSGMHGFSYSDDSFSIYFERGIISVRQNRLMIFDNIPAIPNTMNEALKRTIKRLLGKGRFLPQVIHCKKGKHSEIFTNFFMQFTLKVHAKSVLKRHTMH